MTTTIQTNVAFGDTYRDVVTGFVGAATALAVYQTGITSIRLEATVRDAKSWSEWVDIDRLQGVEASTITLPNEMEATINTT